MILTDYHMHSHHSFDGSATIAQMCSAAIKNGLDEICFTEHVDVSDIPEQTYPVPVWDEWKDEINAARAAFPKLSIRAGVELGDIPSTREDNFKIVKNLDLDFLLLSVHLVDGIDPYQKEYFQKYEQAEGYLRYAQACVASIEANHDYDAFAHFGYVCKFADFPPDTLLFKHQHAPDEIDIVLKTLAQNGKALEINTSGYKRMPYSIPGEDILRRFKGFGGEFVMVSSDAHSPEYVGYKLKEGRELAKYCGFEYTLSFNARKGTPVRL